MTNNFEKPLQEATEDELLRWTNGSNPNYGNLASDELTRRNLLRLNKTIQDGILQDQKSAETEKMFTIAVFLLTLIQSLIGISQFILSFAYSENTQVKIFGIIMIIVTMGVMSYVGTKIFSLLYPNKKL